MTKVSYVKTPKGISKVFTTFKDGVYYSTAMKPNIDINNEKFGEVEVQTKLARTQQKSLDDLLEWCEKEYGSPCTFFEM